ncbi:CD209 antigen-like protein C [Seriola dumerili]|uniref:CD209 antigen-like protein C n=1 Tax=Seriola dumerili TaxID=41447 RepID=UPI000BBE65FB|nr:CD209 antigen-like protein C [Seriola dumerili]
MDNIYANVECSKPGQSRPSASQTGPRSSERRFHGAVVVSLSLLSVLLLAGLIGLGVHHHKNSNAELSAGEANLTECLQASDIKLSSLTEERDQLNISLTEMTKELKRLQSLSKQKKTCPAGWRMFTFTCYFLSTQSDSWEKAREDCRAREADLVIIDSLEKQEFLTKVVIKGDSWIGLTDKNNEKTWKWIDGTLPTVKFWQKGQPDKGNGNPKWGEEDCAVIQPGMKTDENWNDLRCDASKPWICEKNALALT